jgi:hypothetical protein
MEIGTVVSTGDTPNTQNFYFVAAKEGNVKKGLFVQTNTKEGLLIGRIDEIIKTNRYFMQPETISSYEESINLHFPTDKWEFVLCKVYCLGILSERIGKTNYPVSPGEVVEIAEKENLKKLFKFDDAGLKLGRLSSHDLEVKINLNKMFQKHLAILALSGGGKSYATCVLIEELLKRNNKDGKVGVLIIDPHGEYSSFAYDSKFNQNVNLIKGKDIRIGLTNLTSYYYKLFLPNLSFAQERDLNKIVESLKKDGNIFGIKEISQRIEIDENIKQATKDVLLSNLQSLNSIGLFGYYDTPNIYNLISPGKVSILDISEITSGKKKQMIIAYFLRELFNMRVKRKIAPFIAFVEEAHNFAPEKSSKNNFSKGIIEKIAREGRKFNALLCLISQRPVHLSTTSLSQCNTQMYLRITNPYDLKHIGESSEGLTSELLKTITTLDVGESVIVGEASPFPLFVKIRRKEVGDIATSKNLEEECLEFAKNEENQRKNAKDLMK